jgi:hypothetical protein
LKIRWRLTIGVLSLAAAIVLSFPAGAGGHLDRQVAGIWPNGLEPDPAIIWPNGPDPAIIWPNGMGSELLPADNGISA